MTELLPPVQAEAVRSGVMDYLTTTFALTDADARDALDRFLSDPSTGIFKGPYVRLRLPFQQASPGWRSSLEWYEGHEPYGHQAAAFARLASQVDGAYRRPLPTLVTTGTGSGKTEAFLYPILDHVLRARRAGVRGTKALILYPMNALANDQAQRLASMILKYPPLSGVTAALYTGQSGPTRTLVGPEGLITDRGIIRDEAPDLLLTNYKMLDQLLLRDADQDLWKQSATSLQYLVLDEFHTYDGAQGTDVAMLLRRLGLALKSHWADDDLALSASDRTRPLGRITPVATSATLGASGDPLAMTGFAETVFGEAFDADSVITESRLTVEDWIADADSEIGATGLSAVDAAVLDVAAACADLKVLGPDPDGGELATVVLRHLYEGVPTGGLSDAQMLAATKAHPAVQALAAQAHDAMTVDGLVRAVLGESGMAAARASRTAEQWEQFVTAVVAMLGHVRAVCGRGALSVDLHLWVRELTRIDRAADTTTTFRWMDDGPAADDEDGGALGDVHPSFASIYCRHCGRSGWMVPMAPVGDSLAAGDVNVRRQHARREGRARALLHAPGEADAALSGEVVSGLVWFAVLGRTLLTEAPDEENPDLRDGWILPVLTTTGRDGDKAATDDTCPSCGREDAIRFLGSAVATLLSVSLSILFGSGQLNPEEKKALVFTDSVQDAAHRAGFVQARSHALTLRAVLREAVEDGALTLDELVDAVTRRAGDDPFARYRVIAPDCADREAFAEYWKAPTQRKVSATVRQRVKKRLAFDAVMEVGLNSRTGRTLELTGAVAVEVEAGQPSKLAATARAALAGAEVQTELGSSEGCTDDTVLVMWVRGVLDRMRAQGAVDHPWFDRYRAEDGVRWPIWGGRPKHEGMPAFPRGRPAPGYPRVGGSLDKSVDSGLDPVTSLQSWYAIWTSRVLNVSPADGGRLARLLLERLARDGTLEQSTSTSGALVYAIPPSGIVISPTDPDDLAAERHLLVCDACRAATPGTATTVEQLDGAPCTTIRCRGRLAPAPLADGFYRRLYSSPDVRRVVAREHTSLLEDETRLEYENGFKRAGVSPSDPNVLVATPTLEMGIDIGDLSAVFLASLPRTVASYVQRVGRAGRLTGNALNLAYVTGRGDQLPKLGEPLSVINGEVLPPATYLAAEAILQRQYTAHLVDAMARDETAPHPRRATGALGSTEPGSFLGHLIDLAESSDEHLDRFLAAFGDALPDAVVGALRAWASPTDGRGTSGLAAVLHAASGRWQRSIEELGHRITAIDAVLPDLQAKHDSPARTEDDERALRSAKAAHKMTRGQRARLGGQYWIEVLEDEGVLPNYTLLDDTVVLDVGLSWVDPDSGQFASDHAQITRGSAQAIREFAPGATFYARGYEISIDAVDLGMDGESIRPWVFCPACGYARDAETAGVAVDVTSCPRCGSTGIADTGQRIDVVALKNVSAEVRRDEAMITDRSDQRDSAQFQVFTAVDVDPAAIARQWFVAGSGFGATYLRAVDIRWVNAGLPGRGGARTISGDERTAGLFRVCAGCGKLDTAAGRNLPQEHRPWCRFRTAVEENTRQVALSRTLTTQGLMLRLPVGVTLGDPFAVPSLGAAVLLGLREQHGGHPDHLQVARAVDPTCSDGTDNAEGLLLHDVVPGGTGYLAELAEPGALRELLVLAWRRVRDCACRHEQRLACHRCLLPFVRGANGVDTVSRAAAERHLRAVLGLAVDAPDDAPNGWEVTKVSPTTNPESHLEQRFRAELAERLDALGATVKEEPGAWGNTMRFTVPGSPRQWTLRPQVNLVGCKPDFVLETQDMDVPAVAIFTDGRTFHATPKHNRMADDAEKRAILRETGRVVLAVCAKDLGGAESQRAPSWASPAVVKQVIANPRFQASPAAYARLSLGAMDLVMEWITDPSTRDRETVADALPAFFRERSRTVAIAEDSEPTAVAAAALRGEEDPAAGSRQMLLWCSGPLALAVEPRGNVVEVALVLDDRDEVLDDQHADAWREWLQISNHLALRTWPTTITTLSLVDASATSATPAAGPGGAAADGAASDEDLLPADAPEQWRAALAEADRPAERHLIAALARVAGVEVPAVGYEAPGGIPVDMAWPNIHVAVEVEPMPEQYRTDLEADGWVVVPGEVETVLAALRRAADQEVDA